MMTKKEQTLKAIEKIIKKYQKKEYTGNFRDCPLCKIHAPKRTSDAEFNYHSALETDVNMTCLGCPNMTMDTMEYDIPCQQTLYFDDLDNDMFKNRIKYWKKLLPYLKKCPEEMFTKNAKEVFDHSIVEE